MKQYIRVVRIGPERYRVEVMQNRGGSVASIAKQLCWAKEVERKIVGFKRRYRILRKDSVIRVNEWENEKE